MKSLIIPLSILMFFLMVGSAYAYNYEVDLWDTGTTSVSPAPLYCPTTASSCNGIDLVYVNLTGATYSYTVSYQTPRGTPSGTVSGSFSGNSNCVAVSGFSISDSTKPILEGNASVSGGFTSSEISIKRTMNITTSEQFYILNLNGTNPPRDDGGTGAVANIYAIRDRRFAGGEPDEYDFYYNEITNTGNQFGKCREPNAQKTLVHLPVSAIFSPLELVMTSYASPETLYGVYYIPFKTKSKYVKLDLDFKVYGDTPRPCNYEIIVYEAGNPNKKINVISYGESGGGTCYPLNPVLSDLLITGLTPDVEYILMIKGYADVGITGQMRTNITNFTLTIPLVDNYVCGEWSECIDDIQYRFCTDSTGQLPNISETRSCLISRVVEELYLGFEAFEPFEEIWYCDVVPNFGYPATGCVNRSILRTRNYPVGWIVNNGDTLLDEYDENALIPYARNLTGEEYDVVDSSTDACCPQIPERGTTNYALKIWYLPPKINMPVQYNVTRPIVGNVSEVLCEYRQGVPAIIEKTLDNTSFVEINLTALTEHINLEFHAKKCRENIQQYDAFIPIFPLPSCGEPYPRQEEYYTVTGLDNESIDGRVVVRFIDTNGTAGIGDDVDVLTGGQGAVFDIDLIAKYDILDVTIDNLTIGREYLLRFTVLPDENDVGQAVCILLDEVYIQWRSASILTDCVTRCEGTTLIEVIERDDSRGVCRTRTVLWSPECAEVEDTEILEECSGNFCDNLTLVTQELDEDCLEQGGTIQDCCIRTEIPNSPICIAEQEAEEEESKQTQTIDEELAEEMFNALFSPIGLILLVATFIAFILSYFTKAWQIGAIGLILMLSTFTFIGFFPFWYLLVLIVIAGMFFAYTGIKMIKGE